MTFSNNSLPDASPPSLDELLRMQRQLQERTQRQLQELTQGELQQEPKSSESDNEESDNSLPTTGPRQVTAASNRLEMQRQSQQESRSSASDNEDGDNSLSPSASNRLEMQRQSQQESRSSAPDNEDGDDSRSPSGFDSSSVAPRDSHRTSWSRDNLRSILNIAIAILDESDEELEASVESSSRDDANSQP
jgi:hypothetical protein